MAVEHDNGPSPLSAAAPGTGARQDRRDGGTSLDELLARVARGDEEAFAAVYDEVAGTVYGLVRAMAGDPARSEELAGEVLAGVWRTASRFDPAAGSGTCWIMTIARRRAAGHLRAARAAGNGCRGRLQLSGAVGEVAERAGLSLDGGQAGGGSGLPEPQRHALLLAGYGGYTQGQVADFLGVPGAVVSAQIRDGLLKLGGGGQ